MRIVSEIWNVLRRFMEGKSITQSQKEELLPDVMKKLHPEETELLAGKMNFLGKVDIDDEVWKRINYLTDHVLQKMGSAMGGWNFLYRDKNDGRYWELDYPYSEWQGGGPPKLTSITEELAKVKYGKELT